MLHERPITMPPVAAVPISWLAALGGSFAFTLAPAMSDDDAAVLMMVDAELTELDWMIAEAREA